MLKRIFVGFIQGYRYFISPLFGTGKCRFTPTCSAYALEAFQEFGIYKAFFLSTKRICRCHPLGGFGYDPLPMKEATKL
jgi:hypothetical protein